jgi:hypothetical protein
MVYLDFRLLCLIFSCGAWAGARAGAWSHIAVDLCSLSLIGAMRRVGRGAGRRLVPYSSRFTLTEPHRRHAAWRHSRRGRVGGGAGGKGGEMQVGRGGEM